MKVLAVFKPSSSRLLVAFIIVEVYGQRATNESIMDGSANDDNGGPDGTSTLIIPEDVKATFRRNPHVSDWMRELNAMYFFHLANSKKKREDEARACKEEKRRQLEEDRLCQEKLCPPSAFTLTNGDADVKGTVVLPSGNVSTPVDGYLLCIEPDGSHGLLLLCPLLNQHGSYLVMLCATDLLPKDLVESLKGNRQERKNGRLSSSTR